ncbi:unnamed protein product [Paramecium sonneborni]|uniref:WD40-repeat-containing domain n=1 Tax=Paramecium sonneborni TaxID=65129 RepID=A0A8S1Q6V9_9CILI|nr:unnamed protein product [Paramecium sonneborni]
MGNFNQKNYKNEQKIINSQQKSPFQIEFLQFIKQEERCRAMQIIMNNSIFISSCGNFVKVYYFKNGSLSFLQQVKHNKFSVTFLSFARNSQYFISCCDQIIKFWSINGINNQRNITKIRQIDSCYSCYAISDQNQQVVVGMEKKIQFIQMDDQWKVSQYIENHNDQIYNLSFNDSETILISCGGDYKISIIQNFNRLWKIIQIINVDGFGNQAAFIGDNTFIFHPWCSKQMFQYKLIQKNNQMFYLSNSRLMDGEGDLCNLCFSQYIKQKQLFIKQDMCSILIFQVIENSELQFLQSLIFQSIQIQATMSNDGKYLITWDEATQNIQVINIEYK